MPIIQHAVADDRAADSSPSGDDILSFEELSLDEYPDPTVEFNAEACLRKPGVACTCAVGGGFLLAHAGCYVPPVLAFMGVASGGMAMGAAAGAAMTLGGMVLWYAIRGRKAEPRERAWTAGGALAGTFLAASLHLTGVTSSAGHVQGIYNFIDQCSVLNVFQDKPATVATTEDNIMNNNIPVPQLDKL